jgi:hypothetical protein
MKAIYWVLAVIIVVAGVFFAYNRKIAHESGTSGGIKQVAGVTLPEWAPKNPSPEFIRAAKVLKPMPTEAMAAASNGNQSVSAMMERYSKTFPAAYDFFGTLTDEQIKHFQSAKEIRISVKQLTSRQNTALNNWFEDFRKAMQDSPSEFSDYLVMLYKSGAAEDLSNVEVGFTAKIGGGHMVHLYFWITKPDGSVADFGTGFAEI